MEYEGWAIVELMGHRTFGGRVSEVEMFGGKLLRLDVYRTEDVAAELTQFYGASAIYCITPTTEQKAREFGDRTLPERAVPALLGVNEGREEEWR